MVLPLSQDEKRVLELYDKLQQLQLEIALITARKDYTPGEGAFLDILRCKRELLMSSRPISRLGY